MTGTFTSMDQNQYGCDSLIIETITLDPTDTTYLSIGTCDASQVGTYTSTLQNQYGCDSVIISSITLPGIPDTIYLSTRNL